MTSRSAAWLVLSLGLVACGGDDGSPPSSGGAGAAGTSSSAGAAGTSNVGGSGGSGVGGSAGDAGSGAAGTASQEFRIVDVPDAPCELIGGAPTVIMEPEPLELAFDHAGIVGARRYAFDSASLAFMTFGADGTDVSPIILADIAALEAAGAELQALEIASGGELVWSRFDDRGARLGEAVQLETASTVAHALSVAGDNSLALWGVDGRLKARLVSASGELGGEIDFGAQSCGDYGCRVQAFWTGERHVLAWSRVQHDGVQRLSWAAITATGELLPTKLVLESTDALELISAAATSAGGALLLVQQVDVSPAPVVLELDAFGNVAPIGYRLLGAVEGWEVVSRAGNTAVVARSSEEQAVLRELSPDGQPLGAWRCLDDSGKNTDFAPRAAIFAEGTGLGLVVRYTDASAVYLKTE